MMNAVMTVAGLMIAEMMFTGMILAGLMIV
jgi:hypothetical protein